MRTDLSLAEARRAALAAQGFGRARAPARPSAIFGDVGILQIDSVNVLSRAHRLPAFSRYGPYDVAALERLAFRAPRKVFEYWAHEASLVPVATHRLLRWRMTGAHEGAWGGMRRVARERPDLVARVLEDVAGRGPIRAADLLGGQDTGGRGSWWGWSDVKRAVEFLFWSGQVTSARRGTGFERWYDLPERVLPRAALDAATPPVEEAHRELIRIAARHLGVAATPELRDYFRLPAAGFQDRIAELVEDGALTAIRVEGWRRPAYLARGARIPRRMAARALLAPFDPLIWERERVERLFGFRYRLEIYVPAPKRCYGYYVLPFLLGDRLVARVDLKADRQAGLLRVQAAWAEPGAPPETAEALVVELGSMAAWMGLQAPRSVALR